MRHLFLILMLCAAPAWAAPRVRIAVPVDAVVRTEIAREDGLVGAIFRPPGDRVYPGLLVLGGSEGGLDGAAGLARPLAAQGYVALAVAYFGTAGVPQTLQDVPLEYFDSAIERLKREPGVDATRIAVIGGSKGGEAALLIGARRSDLAAVVAAAPSDVVWQGINRASREPHSSWSSGGQPLAYLPFNRTRPFTTLFNLYQDSRPVAGPGDAAIPVERISAPLLLLAGENDSLWPSADMVRVMAQRLKDKAFAPEFRHLEFPAAGHAILGAPVTLERAQELTADGGTADGNLYARKVSWHVIKRFLYRHLIRSR